MNVLRLISQLIGIETLRLTQVIKLFDLMKILMDLVCTKEVKIQ